MKYLHYATKFLDINKNGARKLFTFYCSFYNTFHLLHSYQYDIRWHILLKFSNQLEAPTSRYFLQHILRRRNGYKQIKQRTLIVWWTF